MAPKISQCQITQAEEMQPFELSRPCLVLTYGAADPMVRSPRDVQPEVLHERSFMAAQKVGEFLEIVPKL